MKEVVVSVFYLMFFPCFLFAQYSGGQGTSSNPYKIGTPEDLIKLSNTSSHWGKYFIQTFDITFNADETQVDWDGNGVINGDDADGFCPIGNGSHYFYGNYDGQGHSIENLFIDRASSYYVGLFGLCDGGSISNLSMINVDITGGTAVGGLAGYLDFSSSAENCYSSGLVTGSSLVGCLVGRSYLSPVSDCNSHGVVNGLQSVGGLVGGITSTTLTNSYSLCSVSGSDNIGGLVGDNSNSVTIENCHNSGSVEGNNYVGGLAGNNSSSTVRNSYNTGGVNGSGSYIGGLVGDNLNSSVIDKCYSSGNVRGIGYSGGLVGGNNRSAKISDSYCWGDATRSSGGNTYFGGFCGWNYEATIERCYSIGNVIYENAANPTTKGFLGSEGNTNTYMNNFFDCTVSNQNTDSLGAAAPKTTDLMKIETTFTDWDFTNVWQIIGGSGANYPTLKSLSIVSVGEENNSFLELPQNYVLKQNYPNPFNASATIEYSIPEPGNVTLKIYDLLGRELAVLVDEFKQPGYYRVIFDGDNLSSGMYFYGIKTKGFTQTKKMILLK